MPVAASREAAPIPSRLSQRSLSCDRRGGRAASYIDRSATCRGDIHIAVECRARASQRCRAWSFATPYSWISAGSQWRSCSEGSGFATLRAEGRRGRRVREVMAYGTKYAAKAPRPAPSRSHIASPKLIRVFGNRSVAEGDSGDLQRFGQELIALTSRREREFSECGTVVRPVVPLDEVAAQAHTVETHDSDRGVCRYPRRVDL